MFPLSCSLSDSRNVDVQGLAERNQLFPDSRGEIRGTEGVHETVVDFALGVLVVLQVNHHQGSLRTKVRSVDGRPHDGAKLLDRNQSKVNVEGVNRQPVVDLVRHQGLERTLGCLEVACAWTMVKAPFFLVLLVPKGTVMGLVIVFSLLFGVFALSFQFNSVLPGVNCFSYLLCGW